MEKFNKPTSYAYKPLDNVPNMQMPSNPTDMQVSSVKEGSVSEIEQLREENERIKQQNDELKMALLAAIQDENEFRNYGPNHLTSNTVQKLADKGRKYQENYTTWRQEKARGFVPADQMTDEVTSLIELD